MPTDISPSAYFSFITAALSIVLGLGIVTCLKGVGDTLINRGRVRPYWVHGVWVGQTLLTQIQCFWTLLQNRDIIVELTFFEYLFFWMYPLALYLLSVMLFPDIGSDDEVDLRAHYYENHRWMFAVATVPPLLFLAFHLIYLDLPVISLQNAFPTLFAGITATLAITERSRVHAVLTPVLPVLFLVVIGLYRLQASGTAGQLALAP